MFIGGKKEKLRKVVQIFLNCILPRHDKYNSHYIAHLIGAIAMDRYFQVNIHNLDDEFKMSI